VILYLAGAVFLVLSLPLSLAFLFAMMLTCREWSRVRVATLVYGATAFVWVPLWFGMVGVFTEGFLPEPNAVVSIFRLVPPFLIGACLVGASTRSLWVAGTIGAVGLLTAVFVLCPGLATRVEQVIVLPPSAAGVLAVLIVLMLWTAITRYREPFAGHPFRCRRCGYDTKGLVSPRCPECGQRLRERLQEPTSGTR
jgi:hypothetical protein